MQREEKALVRECGDWSENQQESQSRVGSQNPEESFAEKSCQIKKKRKTKLKTLKKASFGAVVEGEPERREL